jgi:hypothetical protein
MIDPPPDCVYYFYGAWNPEFEGMKSFVKFIEGVPCLDDLPVGKKSTY